MVSGCSHIIHAAQIFHSFTVSGGCRNSNNQISSDKGYMRDGWKDLQYESKGWAQMSWKNIVKVTE